MFRGRKLITLLVSLLGAFLLWLYVVTTIAPETVGTIANIPVTIEGISEGITTSDGTYIMTEQITETITLELRTSRVNLSKLNAQSIRISAYVSNTVVQNGPGRKSLNYSITFPDTVNINDIDILRQSSSTVQIEVAKLQTKTVPVELKTINKVAEGYVFEKTNVTIDPREIELTGPEDEVSKIAKAMVLVDLEQVDLSDRSSISHEISKPLVFLDEEGESIELSSHTTISGEYSSAVVTIPVQRTKEVILSVELKPGGGVQLENAKLVMDTNHIKVKGVPMDVEALPDTIIIGSVDLSTVLDKSEYQFNLNDVSELRNVTNVSGISTINATVTVTGVKREDIYVTEIRMINKPAGLYAYAENKLVKVSIQGAAEDVNKLIRDAHKEISIQVDLSDIDEAGNYSLPGTVVIPNYPNIGIVGNEVMIDIVISDTELTEENTMLD